MKTQIESAMQALVTAGWANGSTGEVESPVGHVAIVDLTSERAMLAQVLAEAGEGETDLEVIRPGWYVVVEDDQGNVTVTNPMSEAEAQAALRRAEAAYVEWSDADE